MSSFHVLIIGAGLGGLALTTGLVRQGVHCTLFERDATPRDRLQGYRIVFRNEPNANIQAMDALRDLLPDHLQDKLFSTAGDGGNVATNTDENLCSKNVFNLPGDSVSLGRMALREVMLDDLEKGVVQFGKKFVSYEHRGNKIVAKFEDGEEVEGDILVAADVSTKYNCIRHHTSKTHLLMNFCIFFRAATLVSVVSSSQIVIHALSRVSQEW
jgi:2-polyprenyl-6-methoxyphenol hydroxylase-like FAD-dependent oxidoreductase